MKEFIIMLITAVFIFQAWYSFIGILNIEKDETNKNSKIKNFFILLVLFIKSLFCFHKFIFYNSDTFVGQDDYTHRRDQYVCKKCVATYFK